MSRRYNELEAKAYLTKRIKTHRIDSEDMKTVREDYGLSIFQVQDLRKEVQLLHDIDEIQDIEDVKEVLRKIFDKDN